jgi:copper chaperone CopZ
MQFLFRVLSIVCIVCTLVFKKEFQKIPGVMDVEALVMLNMINVGIDQNMISKNEVKKKILEIAKRASLKEKIVFRY